MRNEWDLLVDSDGIDIGDNITVENDDGTESIYRLTKYSSESVWLKGEDGAAYRFSADTLESVNCYKVITGKA
jgi:hypothetical protein